MEFEWDENKNQSNIDKHSLSFEQSIEIFDRTTLSWTDHRFNYNDEIRKISIGSLKNMIIVTIAHTDQLGITRIISARPSNKKERKTYYDYLEEISSTAA